MQPVRKVLSATHFKPVTAVDKETGAEVQKLTPCSPGDPAAIEKSWTDVGTEELQEPALTLNDFIRAVQTVRPTVTESDIKKHEEWTQDSGKLSESLYSNNLVRCTKCFFVGVDGV